MLKGKDLLATISIAFMGTLMACGTKGETNIDVRDSDDNYHIQVNDATDEVTLTCTIETAGADDEETVENGTAEYWTVLFRNCNVQQDPAINFDHISYNTSYKMTKDFKEIFENFWSEFTNKEYGLMDITEDNKVDSVDAETICEILAFGELWDENPELFSVERPVVENGSEGALDIAIVYEGMEERYKKADLDKNGYISAQEYVRLRISEYEEIIKEYKDM